MSEKESKTEVMSEEKESPKKKRTVAKERATKSRKSPQNSRLLFSNEFYSDLTSDETLYCALVRNSFSKGIITDVTIPDLPEGYHFYSTADIPGKNQFDTLGTKIPVFYSGKIRYKGEPLGILAGPDYEEVQELAKKAKITLDGTELLSAAKKFEDSPSLHIEGFKREENQSPSENQERVANPDTSKVLRFERKIESGLSGEDFEKCFDLATIEGKWKSGLHIHCASETAGAFSFVKNGILHVMTPSRWIKNLRTALSSVTKFPPEKIVITRTKTSAAKPNLWKSTALACQAAVAAVNSGKAVKLVLTREEEETFIENPLSVEFFYKTAVWPDGRIEAADVDISLDVGAENPFAEEIINRLCISCLGPYAIPNVRIRARAYSSDSVPSSLKIEAADYQASYAIENQMEKIADSIGVDPLSLRVTNAGTKTTLSRQKVKFAPSHVFETLNAVCVKSDFLRKYTTYRMNKENEYLRDNISPFAPPLRGISLVSAAAGSFFYGTIFSIKDVFMEVATQKDGSLKINSIPPSPVIQKIWTKIAASILGLDEGKITFASEFAEDPEGPENISSNVALNTMLLKKCCETLKRKKVASGQCVSVKKGLSPAQKKLWNKEDFSGTPFYSTSFASMVLELSYNPATYHETVNGIWIVVDGGRLLDSKTAESSIKKSIRQALSSLVENSDVPCKNITVQFVQSEDEPKQIGEIALSLLPAAYTAALSQALASTVSTLPLKNDSLFKISEEEAEREKVEFEEQILLEKVKDEKKDEKDASPDEDKKSEALSQNSTPEEDEITDIIEEIQNSGGEI